MGDVPGLSRNIMSIASAVLDLPVFTKMFSAASAPSSRVGSELVEEFPDHGRGAADARVDSERAGRTVQGAGTAFDASVLVHDPGFASGNNEDLVRTNLFAHAAADARFFIELKGRDVFQVGEAFHLYHLSNGRCQATMPATNNTMPSTSAAARSGRHCRISLLTPEGEVNGVLPVKLSARKEDIAGRSRKLDSVNGIFHPLPRNR